MHSGRTSGDVAHRASNSIIFIRDPCGPISSSHPTSSSPPYIAALSQAPTRPQQTPPQSGLRRRAPPCTQGARAATSSIRALEIIIYVREAARARTSTFHHPLHIPPPPSSIYPSSTDDTYYTSQSEGTLRAGGGTAQSAMAANERRSADGATEPRARARECHLSPQHATAGASDF